MGLVPKVAGRNPSVNTEKIVNDLEAGVDVCMLLRSEKVFTTKLILECTASRPAVHKHIYEHLQKVDAVLSASCSLHA